MAEAIRVPQPPMQTGPMPPAHFMSPFNPFRAPHPVMAPFYSPQPIHPWIMAQSFRFIDPVQTIFTLPDLELALYGHTKSPNLRPGHALSGVRLTVPDKERSNSKQRNFSIDKLLGAEKVENHAADLPEGLAIFETSIGGLVHLGVFCQKTVIAKGTRFGPFVGRIVHTSEIKNNDDNSHMWEVFREGRLSHFIDGRGSSGNWMAFVNCARHAQEQNLITTQFEDQIFYEVCRDIPQGQELLVWYGDSYLQFLGIPVALKDSVEDPTKEPQNSEGFSCPRCGKVFAYKYYRDKHLKYTRCVDNGDRKFRCHLCPRSFEKRDRLRIHVLHVHEKHRPHRCTVCGKSFSQSSSLNKHMRVHSGERPYKCVYCNKAFTASSILRTHIRQHSGEKPFKCKFCGKSFASHAAHDSHVRRTHAKDKQPNTCNVCNKVFLTGLELTVHLPTHTESERGTPVNPPDFSDCDTVSEESL